MFKIPYFFRLRRAVQFTRVRFSFYYIISVQYQSHKITHRLALALDIVREVVREVERVRVGNFIKRIFINFLIFWSANR